MPEEPTIAVYLIQRIVFDLLQYLRAEYFMSREWLLLKTKGNKTSADTEHNLV